METPRSVMQLGGGVGGGTEGGPWEKRGHKNWEHCTSHSGPCRRGWGGGASLNGAHWMALVPHLVPVLPPSHRDRCDKEGLLSRDDQKEGKQGVGAAVGKLRSLVEKVGETHPQSRQWGHF